MLCSPFFFCINKLQPNTPFRRVREDEVEIDPRFSNNAFTAKVSLDWRCSFKAVLFSIHTFSPLCLYPSIPAGTVMVFICLHCSRPKHKTFGKYSTGTSPLKHNVCSVHYHYKLISSACTSSLSLHYLLSLWLPQSLCRICFHTLPGGALQAPITRCKQYVPCASCLNAAYARLHLSDLSPLSTL